MGNRSWFQKGDTKYAAKEIAAQAKAIYEEAALRCCTLAEFRDWYLQGIVACEHTNLSQPTALVYCNDSDTAWCREQLEAGLCVRGNPTKFAMRKYRQRERV